jgi:hypothetical protein
LKWSEIAEKVSEVSSEPRTGKQCRERWHNHLDPKITSEKWLPHEEDLIFAFTNANGNQWAKLAKLLPGRTENFIKNYYYSTVRKNLRKINKRLIFREKIQGTVSQLLKDPRVNQLIFCNSKKCIEKIEELNRQADAAEAQRANVQIASPVVGNQRERLQEGWQMFCQQLAGMCFIYQVGVRSQLFS